MSNNNDTEPISGTYDVEEKFGDVRPYDGSARPAPCQSINFLRDGVVRGMVRFSKRQEDFLRFEGRRVRESGTNAGETREIWEKMAAVRQ
ncbi:hypothetical protein IMZ48_48060 [Candidatus Bathyarchaeota archaeon]|nr:hypothetical protein [Candidatus Bathyarchaeota archaeon]